MFVIAVAKYFDFNRLYIKLNAFVTASDQSDRTDFQLSMSTCLLLECLFSLYTFVEPTAEESIVEFAKPNI